MASAEELKKFKGLLEAGVITEEDFEKKKNEVLSNSVQQETSVVETIEAEGMKEAVQTKSLNKAALKIILIGVGIIAILAIAFFAGQKIIEMNQQSKRAAALESAIASIMDDYGLSVYTVKRTDYSYDVFAEGFESLTKGQALSCLKELDSVSVKDPCGDGEIGFGRTNVHPGLDVEYSYWRVSSSLALVNKIYGSDAGGNKTAGLYCNRNGSTCIYECEN